MKRGILDIICQSLHFSLSEDPHTVWCHSQRGIAAQPKPLDHCLKRILLFLSELATPCSTARALKSIRPPLHGKQMPFTRTVWPPVRRRAPGKQHRPRGHNQPCDPLGESI